MLFERHARFRLLTITRGWVMQSENELEIALLRYTEAYADVLRQQRIIAELEDEGHPTLGARTLLRLLESDLALRQEALERLQDHKSKFS